jgi:hypothetical protein
MPSMVTRKPRPVKRKSSNDVQEDEQETKKKRKKVGTQDLGDISTAHCRD